MRRYAAVFVSLFILVTAFAHAQPNLNLKRVVVNWPAVEVYFSVGCNGVPAYNMQATDFRVHDNGEEMGTFTLSCPDPTQPCAMSTTLVFDASGSMAGAGNAGAIAGGMAFVGTMDGQNDEAAVIWFNTSSTLQQGMTSDTSLLNAAVQAIPASGATAVWDALYAGLQETANNGGNSCRAVVVLTDGADNSSTRTPAELIAFAQANHIRVFTIGLGSSFNSIEFQEIAGHTGGRYYQTSSVTQLPMIYQEIAAIIHAGFQECSLVYDATCADGSLHNVEVQLVNFCGGTDTKTKTYLAPIDSSTFSTLPLRLGDVQTSGDADFDMPLLIDTTLAGQSFPQLTIDLCFDSHALGFQGAEIPIGSPLSWMQVLISPTSCGVRIQTQAAGTISGSGELLRLKFHAKVSPPDTAEVGVTASYARLETGCLQPVVSPATVTIAPEIGEPVLSPRCYVPDSLHYDALADAYTPNPFTVRLSCVNIGTDIARDVTARLVLPPGLELANPAEPLTKTVRAGALGPWQIGDAVPEVDWSVRWTKREDHDIDLPIRFIIGGQNNSGDPLAEVSAECSVRIKGLRREFLCTVEWPDTLAMNQAGNDYMPNPVPMRLRLVNSGQLDVRLTRVTFGFSLDGLSLDPSSPQGRDDVLNLTLSPGDHATFDWLVLVQKRSMPRAPRFDWMAYDSTGRSISCSAVMVIPGLPIGALDCELTADTVRADLTAQAYDPMPFTLRLKTRSNKLAVTDSVFARVLLPPGALALAAGDAGLEVKPLSPARIFPQQEAEVEWLLEHPVSTTEQRYTVRTLLWEQGGDTSVCETEVFIPAIPAPFWFTLSASGPTSFCDGGEVTLDAGAGYASYRWSTQDTTRTIVVRSSGTYWCAVTEADGLPGLSHNVTITVFPLPAKPVITRTGDLLATDAAAAWQWYLDGTEIPNATAQTHAAMETGNYTVRITDANGCEALSDPHQIMVLFVDEGPVAGQRFQLYPNPASGELTIDVQLESSAPAIIVLHDLLGRELRRVVRTEASAGFTERMDLRGLRPGLYVMQLHAGTTRQSRVLVVR